MRIKDASLTQQIVAGVAIAVLTAFTLWFASTLWDWLVAGFWWTLGALTTRVTLHLWAVLLGGVAILAWLVRLIIALVPQKPQHTWHDYTSDVFDGARWEWHYDYDNNVAELNPFCIDDHTRLVDAQQRAFGAVQFKCETCGKFLDPIYSPREHRSKLLRQIERKIRSGEWRQVVAAYKKH